MAMLTLLVQVFEHVVPDAVEESSATLRIENNRPTMESFIS